MKRASRTPRTITVGDVALYNGLFGPRFAVQSSDAFARAIGYPVCVKPVAGTESCQARHVGVVYSGRLAVSHEDGTEVELSSGEAYIIEPGHDPWVVGDEGFVGFEFESRSAEDYAKG